MQAVMARADAAAKQIKAGIYRDELVAQEKVKRRTRAFEQYVPEIREIRERYTSRAANLRAQAAKRAHWAQ